jgi:glycerol-3-phosphate acyltransferase PlsY
MDLVVPILLAYLLGAMPNGLLIARLKGIDIRKVGSGNIGATNVMRSVGKPWGIATFVLDALKGFVPAFVFPAVFPSGAGPAAVGVFSGVAAILGHNYPIYLRFRGGKGVATSAGVLLGIAPLAVLIGLGGWLLVFLATRYVSLASIVAAAVIVVCGWLAYRREGLLLPTTLTLLGILAIWRHRSNIQRLLAGTEHRFAKGEKRA